MIELSLALGKTLQELRQMPASDFALYVEYYREQPFGQWRQDYNAAKIAQTMAGGKLVDLMPFWFKVSDADMEEDALEVLMKGAIGV